MQPKRKSYAVILLLLATYAFGGYLGFLYLPSVLSKQQVTNWIGESVILSVIAGAVLTLWFVMIFASYRKEWPADNWGFCAMAWHKAIPQMQRHQPGANMMVFCGFVIIIIGFSAPALFIKLLMMITNITIVLPIASILSQGPMTANHDLNPDTTNP